MTLSQVYYIQDYKVSLFIFLLCLLLYIFPLEYLPSSSFFTWLAINRCIPFFGLFLDPILSRIEHPHENIYMTIDSNMRPSPLTLRIPKILLQLLYNHSGCMHQIVSFCMKWFSPNRHFIPHILPHILSSLITQTVFLLIFYSVALPRF